ncbi:MAG: type 1 glutamine amidotransferase [Firmicutes bacterium]|nr:type 1 glutamine amidotransferase [Bacillota bacterium]
MKRIAILVEDLFDDKELLYPYYRMLEEGFKVDLIGSEKHVSYKSKHGLLMKSDFASKDISANDYDAVIIPGGFSPDYMRRTQKTVDFVKEMNTQGKLIAAICHGPWLMISSCDLSNRKLTGFHSVKVDIENAGATYLDQEVVLDGNFVTSRTPNDLPVFMKTILKELK